MVDDATAAYIVENQKCFEDLKQVASQLAGLLVLAAAGSKEAMPDHPMLDAARELFREADDAVRSARPDRTSPAAIMSISRGRLRSIGVALKEADGAV